jgi:hypothetical protein
MGMRIGNEDRTEIGDKETKGLERRMGKVI